MSKRILLVPLLLAVYMACSVSAQGGIAHCCLKFKGTKVPWKNLKSYSEQTSSPSCSLHAIVFTTVKNKRICAKPNRLWTRKAMTYLDGKRKTPPFHSTALLP